MTQFLNWLESNPSINRSGMVPIAAPVAQPVPSPSGKKKKKGSRTARGKLFGRSKKKRKDQAPVAAGLAPPPSKKIKKGILGSFDVELVSSGGPAPVAAVALPRTGGFTRRDLLLLVAGAGSVALVAAVGGVIASGGISGFLHKLGIGADEEPGPEAKKK